MMSTTFDNGTFDVVYDKGALDALMGDNSIEAYKCGVDLLEEISRILTFNGYYICISLL